MSRQPDPRRDLEATLRMMDVADALRHRRQRVTEHLEASDRQKIREQLLERYREMGHEADPALLDEAIDTVLAQQYRFRPPRPGPGRRLAELYVARTRLTRKFGLPLLLLLALVLAGWVGVRGVGALRAGTEARQAARIASLTDRAQGLADEIRGVALEERAVELAASHLASAESGGRDGDRDAVRAATERLRELLERLEQEYTLRITKGRERDGTRHYLIVRAEGPDGRPVRVSIRNEETDDVELVSEWGERVDRAIYDRVARDFADDGVIDESEFGRKRRGYLEPETVFPSAGRITRW